MWRIEHFWHFNFIYNLNPRRAKNIKDLSLINTQKNEKEFEARKDFSHWDTKKQ